MREVEVPTDCRRAELLVSSYSAGVAARIPSSVIQIQFITVLVRYRLSVLVPDVSGVVGQSAVGATVQFTPPVCA